MVEKSCYGVRSWDLLFWYVEAVNIKTRCYAAALSRACLSSDLGNVLKSAYSVCHKKKPGSSGHDQASFSAREVPSELPEWLRECADLPSKLVMQLTEEATASKDPGTEDPRGQQSWHPIAVCWASWHGHVQNRTALWLREGEELHELRPVTRSSGEDEADQRMGDRGKAPL